MSHRPSLPTNLGMRTARMAAAGVMCVLAATIAACATRAAETSAGAGEPPIAYRRVFVPAENVGSWPRDGEKYIPVEARDFDKWVAAANDADSDHASSVSIDRAEYVG